MKRSYSENDSDDSDVFERNDRNSDGVDDGNLDVRARKRRRGQIEKKRRDRINSSLAELRQLVPAATQKQGSAKLEKAEILQLTVEHLRGLKYGSEISKGLAVTRRADFHTAGFQECIAEVSRCLSAVGNEETGAQSTPVRSQIINHLNCCASKERGEAKPELTLPLLGPTSSLLSKKEGSSSLGLFSPLVPSNMKHEITKEIHSLLGNKDPIHKMQNWGLSLALNYPAIFPLRAQGASDVLHSSFAQPVPLMDWSMALVAKTNISTPPLHPWAP